MGLARCWPAQLPRNSLADDSSSEEEEVRRRFRASTTHAACNVLCATPFKACIALQSTPQASGEDDEEGSEDDGEGSEDDGEGSEDDADWYKSDDSEVRCLVCSRA